MLSTRMLRKGLVVAAAGAAVAGLAGAGSAASAAPSAPHSASTEFHIHLAEVNGKNPIGLVNGAITGGGKDDPHHHNYDVAHLGGGTLRVNHPSKGATFHQHINPSTCFARFYEKGPFTVNHGTGRFAGVHGSGTYVGHAYGILSRNKAGKCDDNAQPDEFVFYVNGTGHLK